MKFNEQGIRYPKLPNRQKPLIRYSKPDRMHWSRQRSVTGPVAVRLDYMFEEKVHTPLTIALLTAISYGNAQ